MALINHNLFKTFNFIISIENSVYGGFTRVSGIEKSFELETYQEGGNNDYVHLLPKYVNTQRLVLERGIIEDNDDDKILGWFQNCINGCITRKNLFISLINKPRVPNKQADQMKTWLFTGAYPVRWTGPELNALGNEIAIEKVEFVYNKVEEQ